MKRWRLTYDIVVNELEYLLATLHSILEDRPNLLATLHSILEDRPNLLATLHSIRTDRADVLAIIHSIRKHRPDLLAILHAIRTDRPEFDLRRAEEISKRDKGEEKHSGSDGILSECTVMEEAHRHMRHMHQCKLPKGHSGPHECFHLFCREFFEQEDY